MSKGQECPFIRPKGDKNNVSINSQEYILLKFLEINLKFTFQDYCAKE